mmetsp:Transcript_114176/g.323327  ORF Transcript_114176/g.323327 Transcript_114176/m.323327 type:complete len:365 (+) Transcript_114176:102-1196(+)
MVPLVAQTSKLLNQWLDCIMRRELPLQAGGPGTGGRSWLDHNGRHRRVGGRPRRRGLHRGSEHLAENGGAQARHGVPPISTVEPVLEVAAVPVDLVGPHGDVGEGVRVLVKPWVEVTHRRPACLYACLIEEGHETREGGSRRRGPADGLDVPIGHDLVALAQRRHVGSCAAAGREVPGWRQPGRGLQVFLNGGDLTLEGVEHVREAPTAAELVGGHLRAADLLPLEARRADGGDPGAARGPRRVQRASVAVPRVRGARVAAGEDDGDAHRGDLGEVVVDVGDLRRFASDLIKLPLPAVRHGVDQGAILPGLDDLSGPGLQVAAEVLAAPVPELRGHPGRDAHDVVDVERRLDPTGAGRVLADKL